MIIIITIMIIIVMIEESISIQDKAWSACSEAATSQSPVKMRSSKIKDIKLKDQV